MVKKSAANILLGAAALYLGYRWWTSTPAAPAPAPDKLSPMIEPTTVTNKVIDEASQFVTKDLVSWMGGKGVNY